MEFSGWSQSTYCLNIKLLLTSISQGILERQSASYLSVLERYFIAKWKSLNSATHPQLAAWSLSLDSSQVRGLFISGHSAGRIYKVVSTSHLDPTSKRGILISWSVGCNFSLIRWVYKIHMLWRVACHAASGSLWNLKLWSISTKHQGVVQIQEAVLICEHLQTVLHNAGKQPEHSPGWMELARTPGSRTRTLMIPTAWTEEKNQEFHPRHTTMSWTINEFIDLFIGSLKLPFFFQLWAISYASGELDFWTQEDSPYNILQANSLYHCW